jgi:hypothetical protein
MQVILSYTQLPGASAFGFLFGTGLGHFLSSLPAPLGLCFVLAGFVIVFLTQGALFALPVWFVLRLWNLRRPKSASGELKFTAAR